ncbi:uncharacterized protein LOC130792008 [Actinidia eriantha]|uniref:uncharacterized protein LOC130792008 n=1 Tax=Actinidia eriantha TaxID=165200 RepID=UPI00258747F9|nr:uncharacterized protein LOC130792008 [Actinidia eriantha]XP_057509396.1 uncharacterized protein LOC130792008 [Actinidia eriantha]
MVLGLRSKHRKANSVQVDYIVNVREIKPWPPSQSLRSIQSVLLQWDNCDNNSGSFSSVVGEGNVEFNESFVLPVTLCREKGTHDSFQKNCLEFYLYEYRKDKATKGQPLGTAIINLSDYGIIKENIAISALVNCKKSSKNAAQPVLYVNVQPFDEDSSNPSPKGSLAKEASLDKDGGEFVSKLVNDANDDESEIASFTDDNVSSHSLQTVSSSAFEASKGSVSQNKEVADGDRKTQQNTQQLVRDDVDRIPYEVASSDAYIREGANFDLASSINSRANGDDDGRAVSVNSRLDTTTVNEVHVGVMDDVEENEQQEYERGKLILEDMRNSLQKKLSAKSSLDATRKHATVRSETLTFSRRGHEVKSTATTNNKLKHTKSVQLPFVSAKANGFSEQNQNMDMAKEVDKLENAHTNVVGIAVTVGKKPNNGFSDSKFEWKSRVEMLEEELREAAVIEAALYSVVAEHGSSTNKVHAPARRLSRFYLHACKEMSHTKRASAARAAVSGLILVSKSCGNDVPRLTFWLSNSIMLRAVVKQSVEGTPLSDGQNMETNDGGKKSGGRSSLNLDKFSSTEKEWNHPIKELGDWENRLTFETALEKIEAWIFSRIVESMWWQTLTPHMQSAAAKTSSKGSGAKKSKFALGDQEQVSFSIELWKKAFKDACERLCPIRAGGHECGCLPVLARLVMEQLVDRLDVAMFNAILRESVDEMPTDPVSDPISDPKVLPILAGRSSFGAGAQLKNAIGNWSRWLSDLFGIEENNSPEDENNHDNNIMECRNSFKAFRVLNALSDLMMLPIEMLGDSSTRKEVCPMFGPMLIQRVLNNFVPDEFSPDPIPAAVLEALDAEDADVATDKLVGFPCTATPPVYSPPLTASLAGFVGEVGSQTPQRSVSSVLRKSYTSDDELDELDSPITSILIDNSRVSPSPRVAWTPKGGRNVVRYRLLREVWKDGE